MVAIFVVLTIATFLLVDFIVQRFQVRESAVPVMSEAESTTGVALSGLSENYFRVPKGFFFHPGHLWMWLHRSGKVRVGVDDFTQKVLGSFDELQTRDVGEEVKQGERLLALKQGERTATFVSPVDGVIAAVNESVKSEPNVIKQNPYESGWVYIINPTNLTSSIRSLNVGEAARSWLQREIEKLRNFLQAQLPQHALVGQTLQDGGIFVDGLLGQMDSETWNRFEAEFLR